MLLTLRLNLVRPAGSKILLVNSLRLALPFNFTQGKLPGSGLAVLRCICHFYGGWYYTKFGLFVQGKVNFLLKKIRQGSAAGGRGSGDGGGMEDYQGIRELGGGLVLSLECLVLSESGEEEASMG